MVALKMKVFDLTSERDIQVTIGSEQHMSDICNVLNRFCHFNRNQNKDIRMTDFLNHGNNSDLLTAQLVSKVGIRNEQAINVLNRIRDCCISNYVYVYTNMFSVDKI